MLNYSQGAKHQSFKRNPRDLLKRICDQHPKMGMEELMRLFIEQIQLPHNYEYLEVALEYTFVNNYNALVDKRASQRTSARELRAQTDTIKGQIVGRLLELVMPNGKTLADCTGAECKRIGGFAAKLAAKVPTHKTVGEVLTEKEVRALWA